MRGMGGLPTWRVVWRGLDATQCSTCLPLSHGHPNAPQYTSMAFGIVYGTWHFAQCDGSVALSGLDLWMQVGAMGRRPTGEDLELAFINASAASSPLTKTAKFLKGLMPKGKDGK